ncbi:hypothetical protein EW145_g7886 [Phellinidium pouzarii]|uniref:Protein kinase domain-containing protein n=1 Tax=Phellinidium pouzarii TaxID=167371 RepID=A0A4S4KDU8_9AGAM|nr:hypothetical protein EW145_g7886 [Phellinidium pouzarii]
MSKSIPSARNPKELARFNRRTADGVYNLKSLEIWWRDHYQLLLDHGYQLRPRFRPDWKPSWTGTKLDPDYCEDSIPHFLRPVIDATRLSDGAVVAIKNGKKTEGSICHHLCIPEKTSNPRNHCVPIFELINDEREPKSHFLVMPLLRRFNDPPFYAVGEVIDFVRQTLEGLEYMHEEGVVHLDCAGGNIMMDGTPLFPDGFHPSMNDRNINGIDDAKCRRRIDFPVKYYFVDFGLSKFLRDDGDNVVIGHNGQDQEVPELSYNIPYDAPPVDIFILGNVYRKKFLNKYKNLEFLLLLVDAMTQKDPKARPSASEAFSQFKSLSLPRWGLALRWRLQERDETGLSRFYDDTFALAREGVYVVRSIITAPLKVSKKIISSLPFRKTESSAS